MIGNLTSQLLSNIYLDMLDRFIVHELGYKAYGRYVDDFYIVVERNRLDWLLTVDMERIKEFLLWLGLTMHPKKYANIPMRSGVDFLGAKVYYDRILSGWRILENMADKVYQLATTGEGNIDRIVSYDGLMEYYKSEKAVRKIYDAVGWDYKNEITRSGCR